MNRMVSLDLFKLFVPFDSVLGGDSIPLWFRKIRLFHLRNRFNIEANGGIFSKRPSGASVLSSFMGMK